MPPSKLFTALTKLQSDLNNLTVYTIGANSCITDVLSLYSSQHMITLEHIKNVVTSMTMALTKMTDALEIFQADAEELMRCLNDE